MIDAQAPASLTAPRHGAVGNTTEISSKFRHGGPRQNSGGPRQNSGGYRPGSGRPRNPVVSSRDAQLDTTGWTDWIGPRWCVIQTHPQAESLAAVELSRSGYRAYAPQIAIQRRDRVVLTVFRKILVPRMPGYGFVELAPSDPWVPVQKTAGVRCVLLGTNGKPSICGVGEVERQMAEDERLCDLSPEVMECFQPGAHVRIQSGAMEGSTGTVVECDGMVTLVEVAMFGRTVKTRLARATLAEAALDACRYGGLV